MARALLAERVLGDARAARREQPPDPVDVRVPRALEEPSRLLRVSSFEPLFTEDLQREAGARPVQRAELSGQRAGPRDVARREGLSRLAEEGVPSIVPAARE